MKKQFLYSMIAIHLGLGIVGCKNNAEAPLLSPLPGDSITTVAISDSNAVASRAILS